MEGVIKSDPRHGLSVEYASARVPDDGRYHVVVDGAIIFSSRVEAAAVTQYEEVRAARRAPSLERQRRERAAADFRDHRSTTWSDKQGRDVKKGGRGIGR